MRKLINRNTDIIHLIEDRLSTRIISDNSRQKVLEFLRKTSLLTAAIGEIASSNKLNKEKTVAQSLQGKTLLVEFEENTNLLLGYVPENEKTATMCKLPESFSAAMNKVAAYLGDDSWLQSENTTDADISFEKQSFSLSMESDTIVGSSSCSDRQEGKSGTEKLSRRTGVAKEALGYPQEYHKLSGEMTLGVLLEPLFDRLFPKNSYIASEKHCRKTTGHSLNNIAAAQLGPDEQGNVLLYKILTDDVLKKIFNDDRIIVLFEQSIHVALLRAVIATALYRLEKMPKKFPKLGGVSFFMDIENEMLQTNQICESLIRLVSSSSGARIMFTSASSKERKGFIDRLTGNPEIARKILTNLPLKPISATRYWLPKFSALVIAWADVPDDKLDDLFPPEQLTDIRQFVQVMNRSRV